eukprot:7352338-Lingulodinium_polyedra.AAC.1
MHVIPRCRTSGGVHCTYCWVSGSRILERLSGGRLRRPRPLPLPFPSGWRSLVAGERNRRSDDASSSVGAR